MKKYIYILLVVILWFTWAKDSRAQSVINPEQFLQAKEILKIISAARKAGFKDDELNSIVLQNNYHQTTLTEVLKAHQIATSDQKIALSKRKLDLSLTEIDLAKFLLKKNKRKVEVRAKFLSVQDLTEEIDKSQMIVLEQLVDDIITN
ncbi:MAG: hypothetical protein JJV97_04115 [SAR324 cluster bacterium]|nr:hypothetical protein [SAR324 cluster bacterium]